MKNIKTLYIILAFCAGLFFGHMIFPSEKEIKPPVYVQLNDAKTRIAKVDSNFTLHESGYKKENDSLVKELNSYKYLLTDARKKLRENRKSTFVLVNKIKQDSLFRPDSLLVDSLSEQIVFTNAATDYLLNAYEEKTCLMERMVAIKDTQIVLCNRSYNEISNLAKEQLLREQKLTEDLNTALKQQKIKRLQNRILAGGLLFISGIATTLYIKAKQ